MFGAASVAPRWTSVPTRAECISASDLPDMHQVVSVVSEGVRDPSLPPALPPRPPPRPVGAVAVLHIEPAVTVLTTSPPTPGHYEPPPDHVHHNPAGGKKTESHITFFCRINLINKSFVRYKSHALSNRDLAQSYFSSK